MCFKISDTLDDHRKKKIGTQLTLNNKRTQKINEHAQDNN